MTPTILSSIAEHGSELRSESFFEGSARPTRVRIGSNRIEAAVSVLVTNDVIYHCFSRLPVSKQSPSWHVLVNGQPHVIVTKSVGDTFWVKDVPETTLATSGAHWVTAGSGSDLHFDLYRDKRKWDAVTLSECIVSRATVGPSGATFPLSGYPAYAVVPLDPNIQELSHTVTSGTVTVLPNASGQVIVAVYRPPDLDPTWISRTSSSGPK